MKSKYDDGYYHYLTFKYLFTPPLLLLKYSLILIKPYFLKFSKNEGD